MWSKKILISIIIAVTLAYYLGSRKDNKSCKVVETKNGAVQGIISLSRDGREFYEWLGIPYAKPPVGNLRFASPEPIGKWEGVRDGSKNGAMCLQNDVIFTKSIWGNEDCLFLNIHVPKQLHDEKKLLPVMVYFHGGAFTGGSSDMFRSEYLMDEDILMVSINYRLGLIGFLSTGDKAIRGNMGLKDQAQALKWIKENIEYFGGDPNQVTIFGHSAGGASVHYLLLSPMTKGLFHKAISHSGAATNTWALNPPAIYLEKTKTIAKDLGCSTDIKNNSEEIAKCLRSASVKDLMTTVWNDYLDPPIQKPYKFNHPVVPTIELIDDDEAFLTQHPLEIITQEKFHKVPWIVGHTAHEAFVSTISLRDPNALQEFEENWEECLKSLFSIKSSTNMSASEKAARIRDFYLPPTERSKLSPEERIEKYESLLSDSFFNFGIREAIFYQRQFSPVYPYFYNKTDGPGLTALMEIMARNTWTSIIEIVVYILKVLVSVSIFGMEPPEDGRVVNHIADMNYVFPTFTSIKKTSKHYGFSKDYVKLIVDFASAKNESVVSFRGLKLEATPKSGPLKFFEFTNDIPKVISEPFQERMKFLHSLNIRDYSIHKKI